MASLHPFDSDNLKRIADVLEVGKEIPDIVRQAVCNRTIPDPNFYDWLKKPPQRILYLLVTALLIFSFLRLAKLIVGDAQCTTSGLQRICGLFSDSSVYYFEVILLFPIVVYITMKGRRDPHIARGYPVLERGIRAENRFFDYWPYLWFSWFALYLLLAISQSNKISIPTDPEHFKYLVPQPLLAALINFSNNLSGLFFFALFVELSEKTDSRTAGRHTWLPVLLVLLVLFAAEWVSTSAHETVLGTDPSMLWGLVSGLITGVFTALVIARLTSKLFDLPLVTIAVLTLYVVIQPVFPFLAHPANDLETVVGFSLAMFALYGKAVLLLAVEWKRDQHRVFYYMVRVARIHEEEEERKLFGDFVSVVDKLESRKIASEARIEGTTDNVVPHRPKPDPQQG
jgi:hypothetical protein